MGSKIRITGLATGLDVDTVVNQMLTVEQSRVDKAKQERQILEWKQEIYRDIIGEINTFKSTYFDVLKTDTYMLSERNYSGYSLKSSDNDVTFSATSTGNVVTGDYKVEVKKLAKSASLTGTSVINIEEGIKNISFTAGITEGVNDRIDFKIDGVDYSIKVDAGNYSLTELASKINSKLKDAENGDISKKIKASVSEDGKSIRFVGMTTIDDDNKELSVKVGDKDYTITLDKGDYTYDELANRINTKLAAEGIGGKLKAEVSDDGSGIHFYNQTLEYNELEDEPISVNNNEVLGKSASNDADNIYRTSINVVNTDLSTNNTLEFDRKIVKDVNDSLTFTVNGKKYTVSLLSGAETEASYGKSSSGSADADILSDLITRVNYGLKNAKDSNNNIVDLTDFTVGLSVRKSLDGTKLQFVSSSTSTINISGNATSTLGFAASTELSLSVNDKVSSIMGIQDGAQTGIVEFEINDGSKTVKFRYDFNSSSNDESDPDNIIVGAKNMSIGDLMDDISSKANVKLSYSQLTRTFKLESLSTGSGQTISVGEAADEVSSTFLTRLFGVRDENSDGMFDGFSATGQDAEVKITNPSGDSSTVYKSSNSFTIDGINYTLKKEEPGVEKTLTVTQDVDKTFDKIKSFIEKYNEIIDKINSKISEKKNLNYLPLTDEQKKEMSEDEIKKWEEKAKEGLLARDSTLENLLYSMRSAFYEPVKVNHDGSNSIGITLQSIGLSTSSDYTQKGKIIIDESKLKEALKNNGDKVAKLLMKTSSTVPQYNADATTEQRTQRRAELGIFQRINDVLQDNLRITRDSNGRKGILLEKAGIKGDYTEFKNLLTEQLKDKDKLISTLLTKLTERENKLYLQFATLETAMQKLNEQSNYFAQMLGYSNS